MEIEDNWFEELQEEIDLQDSLDDDGNNLYSQQKLEELEIMIVLKDYGYHDKHFQTIIDRAKALGYSKQETIAKIKEKKK